MSKKVFATERPTKQDVEKLLKELTPCWSYQYPEVIRLDKLVEAREEELQKDEELMQLKSLKEAAEEEANTHRRSIENRLQKVRQMYRSRGLTDKVLKLLQELVDYVNEDN